MRLRRAVPGGWFRRVGDAEGGGGSCCKGDDGCRGRWGRDGRAIRGERASPGIGSSTFLRHCDVGVVIISSSSTITTTTTTSSSSSSSITSSFSRCRYFSLTSFYVPSASSSSLLSRSLFTLSLILVSELLNFQCLLEIFSRFFHRLASLLATFVDVSLFFDRFAICFVQIPRRFR